MEFDTYALWIDADASYLRDVVLFFDAGVHALVRVVDLMLASFVTSSSLVMGVATRSAEDWWAMGDETNARVVGTHRAAATDRERKIMVDGEVVGLIWKEVGLQYGTWHVGGM